MSQATIISSETLPLDEEQKKFFLMDVIQMSLSASGVVRNLNDAGKEQFSSFNGEAIGSNFKELLIHCNSGWQFAMEGDVAEVIENQSFLAWEDEACPGIGWNVQCIRAGDSENDGWMVSLSPGLAPDISGFASEDGLAGGIGATLHSLFFRTQQTEARFRQFLRLLPGVSYTQDKNLIFSYRNEQLRSLIGPEAFQQIEDGLNWTEWMHPDDRKTFEKSVASCLSNRTPAGTRFRLLLPDGEKILYILDLRIPVRSISGEITGYEGLWLDLTRQTVAEKRLQRAAWKESLAEITGSLSHDFNNILTGIVNLSDLMCQSVEAESSDANDVRIIRDSARQAQQLIQRIVSLNREHTGDIQLHNMVEIVNQQKDLIRIVLPRNHKLEIHLPEVEVPVRVDASAIRRILLNFATNARDAMSYGGQVDLLLSLVDLESYPRDHLYSTQCGHTGQAAELIFRDNGSGIDPKILHRIFCPYFSTKQASRGSGLGLYSMTQFASENGFDFGVKSQLGEGTDMILLIPLEKIDLIQPTKIASKVRGRRRKRRKSAKQVGLYASVDDSIMNLTREFISSGMNVRNLEDAETAKSWFLKDSADNDIFIILLDHRKDLPAEIENCLKQSGETLNKVMIIRGFNPDEIPPQQADLFDKIIEEHGHAQENLKAIISTEGVGDKP